MNHFTWAVQWPNSSQTSKCQYNASNQGIQRTRSLTRFSLLFKWSINSSFFAIWVQFIKMTSYYFSINSIFWKTRIQCFPNLRLCMLIYSIPEHAYLCPNYCSSLNTNASLSTTHFLGYFHFKPQNTLYSPPAFYIIATCVLISYSKV